MVEKRGQPFYLIEQKLYLISNSIVKALDLIEERGVGILQRRCPLGRRILAFVFILNIKFSISIHISISMRIIINISIRISIRIIMN